MRRICAAVARPTGTCLLGGSQRFDKVLAENQLRELRQFVRRKKSDGWRLAGEYVDQASGSKADRPEFQRLFRDAAERKFDLVLFWSLDRFSREGVLETLQHLQRLQANGVG